MSAILFVPVFLRMFLAVIHGSATEVIEELAGAIMNRVDRTDARKDNTSPFLAP